MLSILQIIISIIMLLAAAPFGYLLAWLTREELVQGRIAFLLIMSSSIAVIIALLLIKIETNIKISVILSLIFIFIASLISMLKSYDKRFVRV